MSLVTIDKISDAALAQVVRMRLDAAGIPVHLGSAGHASLFGAADAYSAIRIQVPEKFEARARTLLHELKAALAAEGIDEDDPAGTG